jgi:hypothetical protein
MLTIWSFGGWFLTINVILMHPIYLIPIAPVPDGHTPGPGFELEFAGVAC